jgi:hypothetical protein
VRGSLAHDEHGAVSVAYHGVRDAAEQGSPEAPRPAAPKTIRSACASSANFTISLSGSPSPRWASPTSTPSSRRLRARSSRKGLSANFDRSLPHPDSLAHRYFCGTRLAFLAEPAGLTRCDPRVL